MMIDDAELFRCVSGKITDTIYGSMFKGGPIRHPLASLAKPCLIALPRARPYIR